MSGGTVVVRFGADLRLSDNPALFHAVREADSVVPLFVWDPEEEGEWSMGRAQQWWLHESLQRLSADLEKQGLDLVLRAGTTASVVPEVVEEAGARAVFWNRRYTPGARSSDAELEKRLSEADIEVRTHAGSLLHDPEAVETTSGGPYHVFTPFWRKVSAELEVGDPLPRPRFGRLEPAPSGIDSEALDAFDLLPEDRGEPDWAHVLREAWTPGEAGAEKALEAFVEERLIDYVDTRDRPDVNGTSRLSPYLRHGELSPRQVWHAVNGWVRNGAMRKAADGFLSEIGWREFSYHVLHHYPDSTREPLREKFEDFTWREDADALKRWQQGLTGFPIVDAGMRQLWGTGWMHNRVRMIVASFLTKDLLIHWHEGARWFWDTLVDGDLANNTMGWQWSAGCGADAQPFFRVFNPVAQGRRHDPDGAYVRRWVSELSELPDEYIHSPWEAPSEVRKEAGLDGDAQYPDPLVDHGTARERALEAYERVS